MRHSPFGQERGGNSGRWAVERAYWRPVTDYALLFPFHLPTTYLNPDVLIDSTIWRWKMKKRAMVGMATTVDAAMMYWATAENCCRKLAIPICTTQRSRSVVIVSGHRNEFQLARKKKTASAARIGFESGRITLQ